MARARAAGRGPRAGEPWALAKQCHNRTQLLNYFVRVSGGRHDDWGEMAAADGASELGFAAVAARYPGRTAIIEAPGVGSDEGRTVSYAELAARVNQLSHALRNEGLAAGDCVASIMPNRREYHELRLATGQVGMYFTPISHHLTVGELAYILSDSEAKLVVVDESLLELAGEAMAQVGLDDTAAARCVVLGQSAGGRDAARRDQAGRRDYEQLLADQPETAPEDRLAGEYMGYTSGTTGRPKGVRKRLPGKPPVFTQTRLDYMARLRIYPGAETHLVSAPLYHSAPGTYSTIALDLGHTVVIAERPRPEELLRLIERYRVTITFTVPTVIGRLVRLPAEVRERYDLSSLRSVVHAGAPCPPEIKRQAIEWLGPVVQEFYGATEGSATALTAEEWLRKPGSVGYPIPGVELRVLDDDGRELPAGEIGNVYFRPQTPFEYLKDPAKTAAAMRGDLFTAGDIGHLDDEGWLFLADRRTDLILSGGVNIYPAEVEAALIASPLVADSAVIGVPDDDWGQRVVAIVAPGAGVTADDDLRQRLIEHCRGMLAGYKVPREIRFTERVPRTETGKIRRRDLRAAYTPDA